MELQNVGKAEKLFAELRQLQRFQEVCDNYDATFTAKVTSKHNHNTHVPISTEVHISGDIVHVVRERIASRIVEINNEIAEL